MHHLNRHLVPLLALSAGLVGCQGEGFAPEAPEASLVRMASCNELEDRLESTILETLVEARYGYARGGWLAEDDVAAPEADGGAEDGGGGDGPADWTGTNNQEEGVDELDLVKTDGTHLFVAEDRALHVVTSWPAAETDTLATLELDGWARGLFQVDEDTLVVFSAIDAYGGREGGEADLGGLRGWEATRILTVDISDRAAPTVVAEVDLEGWLQDARMVDGEVYFVANQWMDLPEGAWDLVWDDTSGIDLPEIDWAASESEHEAAKAKARARLRPHVRKLMADLDVRAYLPRLRYDGSDTIEPMFACDDVYAPPVDSHLSMLTIGRLDDEGTVHATGAMADGWTIYASQENLYVAQSSRWWWGFEDEPVSHVHKFALRSGDEPVYTASGAVEGWLYDQFAMSEHDGHLRVVSTDFGIWWSEDENRPDPANHVTVLKDDGAGALDVVGHVGGIAPNEQIQSARMMGDVGYMVTFERVDPLFTLDLSDPTDPRVVGELKIPGFAAYLHPLGDDHLLAVGMDGTWEGQLTGIKVDVYDVSDPTAPTLAHSHPIDPGSGAWSWSEALWDHHAFTFAYDTLTIPAFTEHYDEGTGTWTGFSGTISFEVTPETGIREIGRVDHRDLVAQSECLWTRWYDWVVESDCAPGNDYWYARVRRSLYIVGEDEADRFLYTLSDYGVKVSELASPDTTVASTVFYPR